MINFVFLNYEYYIFIFNYLDDIFLFIFTNNLILQTVLYEIIKFYVLIKIKRLSSINFKYALVIVL